MTTDRCIQCGRFTVSGLLSDEGLCDDCWEKLPLEDDGVLACTACDAGNEPMGLLGSRFHYRCRRCGLEYSREVPSGASPASPPPSEQTPGPHR